MTTALDASAPVDPALFHSQFLLTRERLALPPDWRTHAVLDWQLYVHPALPVVPLRTADGVAAGFALGHLIDPDGHGVREPITLTTADDQLEQQLYRFGGRFVFIVLQPQRQRLYLDPLGSLATVWSRDRRRVASTPTLLLHDEPDHPIFRITLSDYPCFRPNLFFPAGLTAAKEVQRLLANHRLDLVSWTAARHHCISAPEEMTPDEIPAFVARFHTLVSGQIGAMIEAGDGAYLALTGGYDSRRLLACARAHTDRLECVTLESGPVRRIPANTLDVQLARALARQAGVRHRVLPAPPVAPRETADYLLRIGYAGTPGKERLFAAAPRRRLDLTRAWMTGHGVNLDKFIDRPHGRTGAPTGDELLAVVHLGRARELPQRDGLTEALNGWLAAAPAGPPVWRMQLAMLENRISAWACAHLYGTAPFRIHLLPGTHRELIDGMLRLPPTYRARRRLTTDLLMLAWPELLALPFNEAHGLQRLRLHARSAWRSLTTRDTVR